LVLPRYFLFKENSAFYITSMTISAIYSFFALMGRNRQVWFGLDRLYEILVLLRSLIEATAESIVYRLL